ncbi:MAG: heavy metal translocating P-type ATPase [Gammaproteobacteria bacterium]|nr:heavy metal translocating P-type ATPase [Gammaproteobacteria bacterium]
MNIKTIFSIPELDCPSEEKLIRNRLQSMPEIAQIDFNLMAQEVTITHTFNDSAPLLKAMQSIGMQASVKTTEATVSTINNQPSWWLLAISGMAAIAAEIMGLILNYEQAVGVMVLAMFAIILSGRVTLLKGLRALRTMTLNIHFLMMIAITGALIIGEWPEAAMVTVLFALAERIESYSLDKARQAIKNLMAIAPATATVRQGDTWQVMPVEQIQAGATIRVKPGERIPLDGTLIAGQSSVNQAPITGESLPVAKQVGDIVYAGSINERGSFEFSVSSTPQDTLLAKIVRAVQQAQAERAPTQRFVDQFAKYYTPAMVIIAILIATIPPLAWGLPFYPWIAKALVLLVIACPCALVISTPVTVVSGLTAAAKQGILIKGGTYLEQGHRLKAIALDKTGTLTQAKPVVTQSLALNGHTEQSLLHIAASLDSHSEHPVANAIVQAWQQAYPAIALLDVTEFNAITGRGVSGFIEEKRYYVGNHQLAEDNGVCDSNLEGILAKLEQAGNTTIVVSSEDSVLGVLAVADTLRAHSKEAIAALHQLGIHTVMITGDNKTTAQAIAKEVQANLLPTDKLNSMNALLERYQYVGMVGDGMNDAPALAKASIGFAMGKGTDTALETADVALIDDNLMKLPLFFRLSKRSSQILFQNISFAIAVKIVFFVLALAGLGSLWMAVFADMGASLIVVANGLRLLRFR